MERLTTRHNGVAVIKDKSKHKEAMEKLAKYEETREWIPCSERLPDEEEAYYYNKEEDVYEPNEFIVMIEGATLPTVAIFDGEDFISRYNNEFLNKIIAWMPLPEPYKGELANEA